MTVFRTDPQDRQDSDPRIAVIRAKFPALDLSGKNSDYIHGAYQAATRRDDVTPNSVALRERVEAAAPGINLQGQTEDFVNGAAAALVAVGRLAPEAATRSAAKQDAKDPRARMVERQRDAWKRDATTPTPTPTAVPAAPKGDARTRMLERQRNAAQ